MIKKRKDFNLLTPTEQAAFLDLVKEQPNAVVGVQRDKKKGHTDLPLFKKDDQTKLF
jgi:hypothetical protein